jgi:hypothetical protein
VGQLLTDIGAVVPWAQHSAPVPTTTEQEHLATAATDPLSEAQTQFQCIKHWIGQCVTTCPTAEAVRGNITNLERLADALDELEDADDAWHKLMDDIAAAQQTLEALLPVVEAGPLTEEQQLVRDEVIRRNKQA